MATLIELPYPPSLNHYYRHVGNRVLISKQGREYREAVMAIVRGLPTIEGKIWLRLYIYPPDNRRRDIDNMLKALFDALTVGGIYEDDSCIRKLDIEVFEAMPPKGMVIAQVVKFTIWERIKRYVVWKFTKAAKNSASISASQ
jgi:Holliday junction resolvase RusA-like endonuclease